MSVLVYSTCRILFTSNDAQRSERNYSDRSIIQLMQHEFPNFTLQALDVTDNKKEIFNISIKDEKQYKCGRSGEQPDEVRSGNGTYYLWLNTDSRNHFHQTLSEIFALFESDKPSNTDSNEHNQKKKSNDDNNSSAFKNDNFRGTPDPQIASPKDLLHNVHDLGKYIEQGNSDAAARLASQLAQKGARLHADSSRNASNENQFTIQVQFDGNEYGIDQHGSTISIDVFPSTTIRELRAAFELAYQCPPTSQYFFVNGCLAHDDSSMTNLKVGPNSLFVLFLLTHAKIFHNTGPWECPACKTNNKPDNLRCGICHAARND